MLLCIMVDHKLLNVDNHYDSLIKYAIYLSILAKSCLNNYCWYILYTLGILCHKCFFYKHVIVVNMYVSLYNIMSQPITSGNMHTQIDNVLTYAITDITTWGADMPLMVGHVRTKAYLYIFKLIWI